MTQVSKQETKQFENNLLIMLASQGFYFPDEDNFGIRESKWEGLSYIFTFPVLPETLQNDHSAELFNELILNAVDRMNWDNAEQVSVTSNPEKTVAYVEVRFRGRIKFLQ